ncbi:hypothetical protein [Thiocapsa sp.]|uniref:hypothetical protein n=1 Tax=Thiocapsa sp. TaxID=2024551 RepID=UPI003594479D
MENPWHHLPTAAPFVLESERDVVETFNQHNTDPHTRIRLEVLPEPFIGNPEASVVVLSLNPGFDSTDLQWHARPDFAASIQANLRHEPQDYPFYPLNPAYSQSGAYAWWRSKLNGLITDTSLPAVVNKLFCVEWFPYHSVSYKEIPNRISGGLMPSQRYAVSLVEDAIARGATIVAMRRRKDWERHVPALRGYPKVHGLRSAQSAYLSPGNIIDYQQVVKALKV